MTGPKLNEAPVRRPGWKRQVPGDDRGTRAVARYVRMSPYKARQVLDLIRGEDAERAQEILRFSERDAAKVISKVLGSAVANAESNDSVVADELYVSACFADEGPTLKRWRPRARGRATRIRKRTCHITVIVSRLPEEELRARRSRPGGATAERRRRRAGQQQAEARRARRGTAPAEEEVAEATLTEEPAVEEPAVEAPVAEETVAEEPVSEPAIEIAAEVPADEEEGEK